MPHRLRSVFGVLIAWAVIIAAWGSWYAWERVTSPEASPGYETRWAFQFLMFGLFRVPWTLPFLALLLWWVWPRQESTSPVSAGGSTK